MLDPLPEQTAAADPVAIGRRLWPRVLALGLGAVVLAYGGWWWWLAGRTAGAVAQWFDVRRAAGWDARYASLDVGGFPFQLRIAIDGVDLGDATAGWHLHVDGATASAPPWNPTEVTGAFTGDPTISLAAGPMAAAFAGEYTLHAGANRFAARLSGADADFDWLEIVRREDRQKMTAARLRIAIMAATGPTPVKISAAAERAILPAALASPLGTEVDLFRLAADVVGTIPTTGPMQQRLDAWRLDGGIVEIRHTDLRMGKFSLAGEGTLALDRELQPEGAFTARIQGFKDTIDRLADAGYVERRNGAIAKAALGLMAKTPAGGGPAELKVSLTMQDRWLSVGPFRLIRLMPVPW